MVEEYEFKNNECPIEIILCNYCGARLNRVMGHLPTSCEYCNKYRVLPKVMLVKEVRVVYNGDNTK